MTLAELNLKPGDCVLASCGVPISPAANKKLTAEFQKEIGISGVTVLVMPAETTFQVLRANK
jgi:hypothetical protein